MEAPCRVTHRVAYFQHQQVRVHVHSVYSRRQLDTEVTSIRNVYHIGICRKPAGVVLPFDSTSVAGLLLLTGKESFLGAPSAPRREIAEAYTADVDEADNVDAALDDVG